MIDMVTIKNAIGKCRVLLSMSANPYVLSLNVPTGTLPTDQVNYFFLIFSRYSLRVLYHADLFLSNYEKILQQNSVKLATDQEIIIPVPDNVYFDFDAFVVACKGVLEGNIVKRAQYLEQRLIPIFKKIAGEAKASLIDPWIKPIRNECAHLNSFGTSIGSMAWIKKENDSFNVRLDSNYKTFHGKRAELTELYSKILDGFIDICWKLTGIFFAHSFIKYGAPRKNICLNHSGFSIHLSEIDIPGFYF